VSGPRRTRLRSFGTVAAAGVLLLACSSTSEVPGGHATTAGDDGASAGTRPELRVALEAPEAGSAASEVGRERFPLGVFPVAVTVRVENRSDRDADPRRAQVRFVLVDEGGERQVCTLPVRRFVEDTVPPGEVATIEASAKCAIEEDGRYTLGATVLLKERPRDDRPAVVYTAERFTEVEVRRADEEAAEDDGPPPDAPGDARGDATPRTAEPGATGRRPA
jgi:hypothetical protein